MKGLKIRLSKKLVFIVMGSVAVLGGGSGAAAVFVGTDKIFGPSYLEVNGLSCTTLDTVKIKRDQRYWVRKYVVSEGPSDGMARIRTALRVAKAVQEKEKADLVQVAMLDKAGPKDRAQMRGRMIGAQVIYIPDTSKAPEGTNVQPYSAYYVDGTANSSGEYYGLRIDLPLEDAETLTARLTDKADCADPVVAVPVDAHGAPVGGHGEKPKGGHGEASGGHGENSGHGEPSAHGETPGHDAAPATEGHDVPAEGHGDEVAAKQSGGFLSSITGMFFGSKTAAPVEGHAADSAGHAAAPAGDHANTATEEHGEKPATEAHATAAPSKPAPEPRTSAEGGKRWSKQTDADASHSEAAVPAAPQVEEASPPVGGSNDADAAGAAWLAKLRGEGAPATSHDMPATPAKPDKEASTSASKAVH